ncbi:hypothetical protein JCM6882_008406, partial [Rhodosporidiobolus microsporus]
MRSFLRLASSSSRSLRCSSSFTSSPPPPLLLARSSWRSLHGRGAVSPADVAFSVLSATSIRPLQTTAARRGVVKPFVLADIGEGITECEIVKWLVKPGDKIEEFDPLVEVMSDKASVEITSPFTGEIKALSGNVGDMLKVGSTLCDIDVEGEGAEAEQDAATPQDATPSSSPKEPSTSSASTPPATARAPPSSPSAPDAEVFATPATRRIAREKGVDLSTIRGTGKNGRITNEDVLAASKTDSAPPSPASVAEARPSSSSSPSASTSPSTAATIPLSSTRRAMFRAMTASLSIPHFSYSDTLDVTELERLRLKLSSQIPLRYRKTLSTADEAALARKALWGASEEGERVEEARRIDRVTLLPLLLKALSLAAAEHPLFLCTLSSPASS